MKENDALPPDVKLVRDFVNSVDIESGVDEWATPEHLAGWLADRALMASGDTARPADLRRAVEMREALRAVLEANHDETVDEDAVSRLNEIAGRVPLQVHFDSHGGAHLASSRVGVDAALGAVLAAVSTAMTTGTWGRLKVCRKDSCRWAFYDQSKNRSGRWCSMQVCGNRVKTKAFRQRQRSD